MISEKTARDKNSNKPERINTHEVQFTTGPAPGVKLKQKSSKTHGTNSLAMKNQTLILKEEKNQIFMEHLELTRKMFVTGLMRMRMRISDTRILRKKELHNKLKRTVQVKG
jgi:hypothetical protein